jgi:hypothetical protein
MSSTVVRNNPGAQTQHVNNYQIPIPVIDTYGRVFHIVKNDKDPGYTDWSSIGKVYFTNVNTPPPKEINNLILNKYAESTAFPLIPYISYFPNIGEIIYLKVVQNKIYYSHIVNIYNSQHHNSQVTDNINDDGTAILGSYTQEKNVPPLYPFEGDLTINGRWGNGIRFSSTLKYTELNNTWSSYGNIGDPIIKIVNGYKFATDGDGAPHIEDINKDNSSIYMTSNQSINLSPTRFISSNPLTSPLLPSVYTNPQLILASDRITLNAKKDEVILCANTNIELSAKQNIHLDSDEHIFLNSPKVFLGINENSTPKEPALLGKQTFTLLSDLISALNTFSSDIKSYTTQGEGVSNPVINSSADILRGKLKGMRKRLTKIYSKTVFVAN